MPLLFQDSFEPYYAGREGETRREMDAELTAQRDETVSRRTEEQKRRRRAAETTSV